MIHGGAMVKYILYTTQMMIDSYLLPWEGAEPLQKKYQENGERHRE